MRNQEHLEQVALINWFRLQYPFLKGCLWAVPNGGVRNIGTAIKLKREGVISGVADLFLMCPRGLKHGLFIELKSKTGKASPNQLEFQKLAQKMGYEAEICYGFMQAKNLIINYLSNNSKNTS
jgi:hypothetical protein